MIASDCGDPRQRFVDDLCRCYAPLAAAITGPFMWSLAGWVHPDFRRSGLGRIRERTVKAVGLSRWNPPLWIAVMDDDLVHGGLAKTYGAHHAEKGVIYRQYGGPVFDMYLLTMTHQQMLDSLILPATAPSVAVAVAAE